MGAADFRVGRRIFATFAHEHLGFGNLMLSPELCFRSRLRQASSSSPNFSSRKFRTGAGADGRSRCRARAARDAPAWTASINTKAGSCR
jgi:hypothetical protein